MATPLRPGTFLFSEALSMLSASSVWVSEASLPQYRNTVRQLLDHPGCQSATSD